MISNQEVYRNNTKINNILMIVLLVVLSLIINACGSIPNTISEYKSNDLQLKIDGISDEWINSLIYYQEQKIALAIKNDDKNLYICLKTSDIATQRKITTLGLTLWIDNTADKDKSFGIKYPVPRKPGEFRADMKPDRDNSNNKTGMKNRNEEQDFNKDFTKMRDEYFAKTLNNIVFIVNGVNNPMMIEDARSKYNINTVIKKDNDVLTYELCIPFKSEMYNFFSKFSKDSTFYVGLETGEIDMEDMPQGRPFGGGPDGGGMGMPPGGGAGMGGGPMGGNMPSGNRSSEMSEMSKKLEMWLNIKFKSYPNNK